MSLAAVGSGILIWIASKPDLDFCAGATFSDHFQMHRPVRLGRMNGVIESLHVRL